MSNVWHSFLGLEVAEGEAGSLPHDAVFVSQQSYQVIDNNITVVASAAQGDGGHCTNVGVLVIEQLDQSIHHSWILELSCGGGRNWGLAACVTTLFTLHCSQVDCMRSTRV